MVKESKTVDELTPKQELLISALLTPLSIDAASKAVGITKQTAFNWMKQEHFQTAYKAAKKRMADAVFEKAMDDLIDGIPDALSTLRKHMKAEDVQPSSQTQMKAAELWLARVESQIQTKELAEKVALIESFLKDTKTNG